MSELEENKVDSVLTEEGTGEVSPVEMSKYIKSEKRSSWIAGMVFGLAISLVIVLAVGFFRVYQLKQKYDPSGTDKSTSNQILEKNSDEIMKKLQTIQELIDQYYLYDIDENNVVNSLYSALLNSLGDPYAAYYTQEQYAKMMEESSGTYCGIGVVVIQDLSTKAIRVDSLFANGPGEEAGIKPGDILIGVDGNPAVDEDVSTVVSWIKGEENTTVDITVLRDGQELTLTVERRQIDIPTVECEMLDDGIGYVAVAEFDQITKTQFTDALDELGTQGMKSLIIDLRGNPGGYLDVTLNMADYLLPEGLLLYTMDKYGNKTEYTSDSDAKFTDIPIVILINGSSASASEVFAGAMQDYERATIVGTQSFGKGIVQSIMPLDDGSGIKLTVSDYYTPLGNNIHGVGITPDVVEELEEELQGKTEISLDEDNQVQKAIEVLKGKME